MTTVPETLAAESTTGEGPAESTNEAAQTGLIDAVQQWLHALRVVVARAIDISILEARLAALNFVLILIIAVASGLLLATAWIAFFAAVVAWFHELGLSWSIALLLMASINLLLAIAGGFAIYRMSNNLLFKAIRKFIMYGANDDERTRSSAGEPPPAP
jgi:hypothetical protein